MDRKEISKKNAYFSKKLETMSREDLRKLQVEKTKETLERAYHHSGFYRHLDEKISVAYFQVGPTAVEIMEDLDGTGEVARFIEKRGEGVMLVSFNVDSCNQALDVLKKNGASLVDAKPRFAKELNRQFAFIHPKVCHGILTEVIEGKY